MGATSRLATNRVKSVFRVGDPKNRYTSIVRAVDALYKTKPRQYVALACLISCYIDAVAARGGKATKKKFLDFLRLNFRQLCKGLDNQEPKLDGAEVFYKYYRSEMVHTFFSRKRKYAIAEDDELNGAYVGQLHINGATHTAVNVDRLYRDLRALAKRKAKTNTL
jgi:hypothetical protein